MILKTFMHVLKVFRGATSIKTKKKHCLANPSALDSLEIVEKTDIKTNRRRLK